MLGILKIDGVLHETRLPPQRLQIHQWKSLTQSWDDSIVQELLSVQATLKPFLFLSKIKNPKSEMKEKAVQAPKAVNIFNLQMLRIVVSTAKLLIV